MDLPELRTRSQLHRAGYSDVELRQLLRAGQLTPIRRGTYLCGPAPEDPGVRHAVAARATLDRLAADAAASHITAAVLHGLPTWRVGLDRVHITRFRPGSGSRATAGVHVHGAPLHPGETVIVAGVPVTSMARTLVDVARTVPFEQAVVVADAALRGGLVQPGELAAALARAGQWRGVPDARRALSFADGRSESVGESRSRVAILRAGLPVPVPQWQVLDRDGSVIARTDFGWPGLRTVGEFDGRIKYGRLLRPGQDAGDVVFAEKLREDRLRDLGLAVVRWTWADLTDFTRTADRLRRRLAPDPV